VIEINSRGSALGAHAFEAQMRQDQFCFDRSEPSAREAVFPALIAASSLSIGD
jgi:hypothetical protein